MGTSSPWASRPGKGSFGGVTEVMQPWGRGNEGRVRKCQMCRLGRDRVWAAHSLVVQSAERIPWNQTVAPHTVMVLL